MSANLGRTTSRLGRFFGSWTPLYAGGSNFGAMCERAELMGAIGKPCPGCGGGGARALEAKELAKWKVRIANERDGDKRQELRDDLSRELTCRFCDGSGWATAGMVHRLRSTISTTTWCGRCRGTGEVYDEDNEDRCPRCNGDSYYVPITIREMGSSKHGRTGEVVNLGPDDYPCSLNPHQALEGAEDRLTECGRSSRIMAKIERIDASAGAALEAYYGPVGDRCAGTPWHRQHALWPLTEAGRRLVEIAKRTSLKGHAHLLSPIDLLIEERAALKRATARGEDRPRDRILHARADREARELLLNAHEVLRKATEAAE